MDTAQLAAFPITAEIPFLNPVTKNKFDISFYFHYWEAGEEDYLNFELRAECLDSLIYLFWS